jgi:hypothetical protein
MHIPMLQLFFLLIMSFLLSGCDSQKSTLKLDTIYYKDFDIFKLEGIDTLKDLNKKQSVEVRYNNNIPVYIKYYKLQRTVTLKLDGSFSTQGKPVYVFSTSNFHGGQPGPHRVYATHNEEYKDLLYICLSDTIICKSYEATKLDYYSYTLYIYFKNSDKSIVKYITGSDTKEDKGFLQEEIYLKWLKFLRDDYSKGERTPEIIQKLPE